MSDHPEDTEAARDAAIKEAATKAKEEGRRSGRAWQAKDMDTLAEEGVGGYAKKAVSGALAGQDAADMVEAPAFQAASASILDQPILVIHQDARVIEVSDEYHYSLPDGTPLGVGRQSNQGIGRKLLRMTTSLDSKMKTVVEVTQDDTVLFTMERKGSIGKNTMVITDASGATVGEIRQTKRGPRRASFELVAEGQTLATARTGGAWEGSGYDIVTPDEQVVAYVRTLHKGVLDAVAKSRFSDNDHYVLRLERPLEDPLRTLVVATPMSVDSAVSQRDDGMNVGDIARGVGRIFR